MVNFQTKHRNLGKVWKALQSRRFWYCLWPICLFNDQMVIFYGHLVVFWYIFSRFGMLRREKSGSTATVYGYL
jgi:hypothetical protein